MRWQADHPLLNWKRNGHQCPSCPALPFVLLALHSAVHDWSGLPGARHGRRVRVLNCVCAKCVLGLWQVSLRVGSAWRWRRSGMAQAASTGCCVVLRSSIFDSSQQRPACSCRQLSGGSAQPPASSGAAAAPGLLHLVVEHRTVGKGVVAGLHTDRGDRGPQVDWGSRPPARREMAHSSLWMHAVWQHPAERGFSTPGSQPPVPFRTGRGCRRTRSDWVQSCSTGRQ